MIEDIEGEVWKPVLGWETRYAVSNMGRVQNIKTGRILKPQPYYKYGHLMVRLCQNGDFVQKTVHRLVAETFIPNPDNLPHINHKDENPQNNAAENLEWCTPKYNANYGTRNAKISAKHKNRLAYNKGTHIFTNGEINIRAKECPDGFRLGYLPWKPIEK